MNAKEVTIIPNADNVLRTTVDACTDNENTITLNSDETYGNVFGNTSQYIVPSKSITIQAAEGANPVIKPVVPIRIGNGVTIKFIGIKFDGSILDSSSYDYLIRFNDTNADNALEFEDCEFTGIPQPIIYVKGGNNGKSVKLTNCTFHENSSYCIHCPSNSTLGSCIIDNCYFYSNTQMCLYLENTAATPLTITNSTFANNSNSGSHGVVETKSTSGDILVNHCTFYNCPVNSSSYGTVKFVSADAVVSNSIFAMPSSINQRAIHMPDDNVVNNCLTYNYTYDTDGIRSGIAKTGCLTGNPYFVNMESGSYDFTTASFSPAHNAGTDTKTLGDYLRWTSDDSAHPTTKNITAGAGVIKAAIEAAWPGDNIVLAAGEYTQGENYTVIDKNIVLKAATSTAPIVKFSVPMHLKNGARAEFKGLKFDMVGLHTQSWYEHLISAEDASDGKKLILDNCELYNDTMNNSVIYCASGYKLDSLNISNCKFYDIKKSCIFLENTGLVGLSIVNSTFNNVSTVKNKYYAAVIDARTTTGKIRIDHCTFNDCFAMSTDYAIIKLYSSDGIVSNSIFAMSSSTNEHRTIWGADGGGTKAKNCLVYNYTIDSNVGMRSAVAKTDCFAGNPLFTDAAEGDFSYPGNWSTGNVSPARNAGADGSDLGDANWYTDEVIPSTDFEDSYTFASSIALLSGNIGRNANDHIQYTGSGTPGTATWKIHAEQACTLRVAVNIESGSDSGHKFTIKVRDSEKNLLTKGSVAELSTSWSDGDIALFGRIAIPEAGDYYVELSNATTDSGAKVEGVTFIYAGGNTQNIPNTLSPSDAVLSDSAWVDGSPEYINFKKFGNTKYNSTEWAKWRVIVSSAGLYTITANVTSDNGQYYGIYVLSSDESSTIGSKEGSSNLGTGDKQFSTSPIELATGEYVVKIVNRYPNSRGRVLSIDAIYEGGSVVDVPSTLDVNDAILSPGATCSAGVISVSNWSTGWVKWRTHVAETEDLYYDIKLNVLSNSGNGHNFSVAIYKDENADPVSTISEGGWHDVSGTLNLGRVTLEGNTDYVFKVTNATGDGSTARIIGAACEYAGGKKIAIPGTLNSEDAVLEKSKLYRDENNYIHYNNNGTPGDEYVYWKIHTSASYSGKVILDIPVESGDKGHEFHVELYSSLSGSKLSEAYETSVSYASNRLIELDQTFVISEAGDYYIKLANATKWSSAILRSISIAPAITLDEEATTIATVIEPNHGKVVNAQLTRSLTAGMYNTICLPFAVNASEVARVFGAAKIIGLTSSSIEEGDFVLNLNFDDVTEMVAGTPYLIKPAANISNPKFLGVTIDKTLHNVETDRVDFIGNFVAGTIPAGEDNLFLGANDMLYFSPTQDMPILGMRAYFNIHDVSAGAVRRARIVAWENVVTEIEFTLPDDTNTPNSLIQKRVENGQLLIIREGAIYNALGVRIK